MNRKTRRLIPLAGLGIVLLSLACAPCSCLSRLGAPPPPERIEVSPEAAQRLEEKLKEALSGTSSGEFTITATDEEVTSLIAVQMEKTSDTPMRDVQVHFGDDRLQVDIVESSAGVIPVPQSLLDSLSRTVNETIAEAQTKAQMQVQITEVTIGEGEITISGKPSPTLMD
jgi:hypothetical protein